MYILELKLLKLQLKQNAALAINLISLAQLNMFKYQNYYNWNKDEYKYCKKKKKKSLKSHIKMTKTERKMATLKCKNLIYIILYI